MGEDRGRVYRICNVRTASGNGRGAISALILEWVAAVAPIIAAMITVFVAILLRQVHVLVNSKMTEALDRIKALEKYSGVSPGEQV